MPILARAFALASLLALAGCSSFEDANPFVADTIEVACPPLGAVREGEALTRFRPGPGRDLTDVLFEARISRVVGKCQVTQSTLIAEVTAGVEILAERGPALETVETPLEYFVAVRAPNGEIAARESFPLALTFARGARETRAIDYLAFTIPNATPEALRSYRVFFGLQMTRDEWDYAQRAGGQRR